MKTFENLLGELSRCQATLEDIYRFIENAVFLIDICPLGYVKYDYDHNGKTRTMNKTDCGKKCDPHTRLRFWQEILGNYKEMIETASPDAFKKIHAFIMQENGQVIGIVSNDLPFQVGDTIQNQDNGIDYVVTDVKKVLIVRPVTGLDTVLQKSFLKEPVEQGIKIFEYSNGTFYFEVAGKKQEAIFWANEKEVMKLIKDVCKLYGKQFDSLHPVAIINDDRLKFVAVTKPASNNLYMYLDLNYPESNAQI